MATPKLVKMGIKRKEMYPESKPQTEKDYDKEEVRPELHLTGPHAEMMGAPDLKKGDRVQQTVQWVVKDHAKHDENGKPPRYEMTLCLDKAGDQEDCGNDSAKGDEDDGDGADDSPAMSFIKGAAAKTSPASEVD